MYLVDEEQRALPGFPAQPRLLEHFLQVGDAGKDRRNLLEIKFGFAGKEPRHSGFARARRAPEDQRAERARLQHPGQRAVRTKQMILPNNVGELVRAQLVGKRTRRITVKPASREQRGTPGLGTGTHRRGPSLFIVIPRTSRRSAGRRAEW